MRKIDVIVLLLIAAFFVAISGVITITIAEPVDTYHNGWNLVRDTAAEDGATFAAALDLAGSEGDFANKPSGAFYIRPTGRPGQETSPGGGWIFAIAGTDAADETFSFTLVGWARLNGMAQVLVHGDGVLGTQDVVLYPHDGSTATNGFWADTINLDATTSWPSINSYNSGNDEVGIIAVDLTGLEWIQFFIYDAAGSAEAVNITVLGRRY